jgi:glycerol-3-phosphate dehydrogenase
VGLKKDVVIIGGGATGAGVARDLAMRGVDVLLAEKGDLCSGTSGRCHGLLHSGARYAVSDPDSAGECAAENRILKNIIPHVIEDCGGLFVSVEEDREYENRFIKGCARCGVPAEEITVNEVLSIVPNLNKKISSAYRVPDASIDPFQLVLCNILDAVENGAEIKMHREVAGFSMDGEHIKSVQVRKDGHKESIRAEIVVNASGPWVPSVANMAGVEIPTNLDKGSLLVLSRRISDIVVNRLRMPTDGDIIVPNHTTSIIGTTSSRVDEPGNTSVEKSEVQLLLREASKLIPDVSNSRVLRGYAGVRPLVHSDKCGRDAGRGCQIIIEGNLISVLGGKLTTYRLMAERVSDAVCKELGVRARCRTHKEKLGKEVDAHGIPGSAFQLQKKRAFSRYGGRVKVFAKSGGSMICNCEHVSTGEIRYAIRDLHARSIEDVMRRTRAGMGPCQGSFCAGKIASLMCEDKRKSAEEARKELIKFFQERWNGIVPVLGFEQLRQERLHMAIHSCVGNYDRLERGDERNKR